MLSTPKQRKLATDTYNKLVTQDVHDEQASQLLHTTIATLKAQGANIAEMSLLYCLESDFLFENKLFDDAYRWAMDAFKTDSERKEVLELMIKIYSPRIEVMGSAQIESDVNPYVDDEKAKECAINLQTLYNDDPDALYSVASCYSSLGLYDDALRVLKQAFFKITSSKGIHDENNQIYSKEMVDEIKKTITQTFIDRYSSCDNHAHQTIIQYLIELVEWKYTDFGTENMKICIGEIWERLEYVLGKHLLKYEEMSGAQTSELLEHEWGNISNLLGSIPCSIPLSSKLLAQIVDILHFHQKYEEGIQFFSRLITEYQTYSDNMTTIYAKFTKYDLLYLHRAKIYQIMGQRDAMMEDIEEANTRRLCNDDRSEQITERNILDFPVIFNDEQPLIETVDQIKKRRDDLRRESMKSQKERAEMERLQSKIAELTEDLNRTVIETASQTLPPDGEGGAPQEAVPESTVQELAKQNESYQEKMEAMRREIKILRDCQSKLAKPTKKKGCCGKIISFLMGFVLIGLVVGGGMVHLYGWEKLTDFLVNLQGDVQREINVLVEAAGPMIDDGWRWMDEMKNMVMEEGISGNDGGVYKAEV